MAAPPAPSTHHADAPIVSVKPVTLRAPERGTDLQVRISAPLVGEDLPVLLLSHGYGWSMDGYGPLADFYAAHGFVVLQPTYLDSRRLALDPGDSRVPGIWRRRVADAHRVLDDLDRLVDAVPGLPGRVDAGRVVAVGHSFGAQTTGVLLGARVLDAAGVPSEDAADSRIAAGVLLAPAGTGGADLTPFAAEHFPFMNPDFSTLTRKALVVVGDRDDSPLTVRGPDWLTDAFRLAPGAEALLTLPGAEHSLGGVAGYDVAESTDADPDRLAVVQRLTLAWLRSALDPADGAWDRARAALDAQDGTVASSARAPWRAAP